MHTFLEAIYYVADLLVCFEFSMRGQMFTGFCTIAGFLFAVKSFATANFLKEIYNSESYRERIASAIDGNEHYDIMAGLRNFTKTLKETILICISVAFFHLLSGLLVDKPENHLWISLYVMPIQLFTCYAVYRMVDCTSLLNTQTDEMFKILEEDGKRKLNAAQAQEKAARDAKDFLSQSTSVRINSPPDGGRAADNNKA
jgi:hypothetical protein